MGRRKFGVSLLSTPEYYLFSEEEIKAVYYNLIKHIKYKYKDSDYDYSILVGISNVDGKSVSSKIKSNSVGRPKYIFMPKNKNKGVRYVNWHMHIMICGAPLGTIVKDIEDYLQKILNKKLVNEEFDKRVYECSNFTKYYVRSYKKEIVENCIDNINLLGNKAIKVITNILDNDKASDSVRLNASKSILDMILRFNEQNNIVEKVKELEELLKVGVYNE